MVLKENVNETRTFSSVKNKDPDIEESSKVEAVISLVVVKWLG